MLHTEADINYTSLSMLYLYKAQSIMCLWCSVNSTQSITKSNSTTLTEFSEDGELARSWVIGRESVISTVSAD